MIRAFREILSGDVRRGDERWSDVHAAAHIAIGVVFVGVLVGLQLCRPLVGF